MTSAIVVVNKSTLVANVDVAAMVKAVDTQLRLHVAPRWQRNPWRCRFAGNGVIPAGSFPLYLLDDPDQANALGYHDETPDGQVYARVFARPVLDNGGDALSKPLSVASVVSHEACETFADQTCNLWADRNGKNGYAVELCDPVEADSYNIGAVTVSNFVLPAWFDPHGRAPFDHLAKLTAPFTMDAGGYVIVESEGKVTQQFGDRYPEWRKPGKHHPAARTHRRGVRP